MKEPDSASQAAKPEEWQRIHQEENSLTMEERKSLQIKKLQEMLASLHTLYGPGFIAAIKSADKRSMSENDAIALADLPYKDELIDRINGLRGRFGDTFYSSIQAITGEQLAPASKQTVKESTPAVEEVSPTETPTDREPPRNAKLPKGFNKWDLKMIKLHESRPSEGKRIWVEFWSLKGISYVGEILFNPTKQLFYFKPYDISNASFALTEEQARKATAQARNYYFRVSPNPPEVTA